MDKLKFRQVHLDFHTSPAIKGVGEAFDKEQFQAALKEGHVESITLFSKCHHGYSFHPTDVNIMHPGLKFDLLGAELEACREIGVRAPVYISAGFDEKYIVDFELRLSELLSKAWAKASENTSIYSGGFERAVIKRIIDYRDNFFAWGGSSMCHPPVPLSEDDCAA